MSILNYFRDSVGRLVRSTNSNAGGWSTLTPNTGLNTIVEQGKLILQTTTAGANKGLTFDGAAASAANTISIPVDTLFDLDITIIGKQSGSNILTMTKRRVSGIRGLGSSGFLQATTIDTGAVIGTTIGTDNNIGGPDFSFDDFFVENFGGSGRYLQVRVNASTSNATVNWEAQYTIRRFSVA